jgi:iron complex transport system substrate-binding protein
MWLVGGAALGGGTWDGSPALVDAESAASNASPQRIVAIAPNTAEVICELGACDRIVAVSKFCVYPPELTGRPRVGGLSDPDLERITAVRPDLLVMRGRNDSLARLTEQLGIPIHYDETDTLPGIEECVRVLGQKLGRSTEAEDVVSRFRERLDAIRFRVAGRPRPRVLLTVSRDPARLANLLTTGSGTFLGQMIEVAGGTNVFGHLDMLYPQVSPEGIIAQQPEVILELLPEVQLSQALREQLLRQWREMESVPAVTRGQIHFLTDENCLIPSPRYVEFIEKVSRILHPEPSGGP